MERFRNLRALIRAYSTGQYQLVEVLTSEVRKGDFFMYGGICKVVAVEDDQIRYRTVNLKRRCLGPAEGQTTKRGTFNLFYKPYKARDDKSVVYDL